MIIKNKTSSNLLLSIEGSIFSLVGILQLTDYHSFNQEGLSHWTLGFFFLPFGLTGLFILLDNLYVIIDEEKIEIKSIFRKKIIDKKEILKYGIEKYKGKYVSGERIRIFTSKNSYKFHSSQLESIAEIKQFVKGKKQINDAFKGEGFYTYIIAFLTVLAVLFIYTFLRGNPQKNTELEAIGIPVILDVDMNIVREDEDRIIFKLDEYKGHIFAVDKADAPSNLATIEEELIVFILGKELIQELSDNKNQENNMDTTRIISVDGIDLLK